MKDKAALEAREVHRREQDRYLAVYDEVKAELLRIPGVVEVGVGLRERGGKLTHETAFRVYVRKKLPQSAVQPENRIPKEIRGFPTDVIEQRSEVLIIGFDDENDDKNYKTKVGGCEIGVDEAGSGQGTLGCFARLNSDNSVVILSCFHVLMQNEFFHGAAAGSDANKGVGQPDYSGSCCCTCNEIATTLAGGDKNLDCALAKLKPDVKFAPKIKTIKKGDGTTELSGFIEGTDDAVKDHEVWKVGERTGLTRGTVAQVTPLVVIHPKAPFTYFADHGDSGSVVVDTLTGKVVGLLRSIDKEIAEGGSLGNATPIGAVLARLGISVITTDESQSFDVRAWTEERTGMAGPPTPEEVFSSLADRLNMTERGRELLTLVRLHRLEVTELINHRRPVTVAWHRSQGPAYMAALMRSAREPAYRVPATLNGVSREEVVERMREVLLQHGSERLRAAIQANADRLIRLWLECSTLDELTRAWEQEAHLVSP